MESKNNSSKALKAGFWYVFAQILVKGSSFICTPFFTRLLTTSQYGEVKVYESWMQIFLPLFTLSLYFSIERAKYEFESELDDYTSSIMFLIIVVGVFIIICSIPLLGIIANLLKMTSVAYLTILLYCISNAAILMYQRRVKLDYKYKKSIALSLFSSIPGMLVALISVFVGKKLGLQELLVDLRIYGMYLPQIVLGLCVVVYFLRRKIKFINSRYWNFALTFSLPLIPSQLSMIVLNQSDKIMIQRMCDSTSVGLFSLASTVMYILYVIEQAIGDAWLPWLYEKLNTRQFKDLRKPWLLIMIIVMTLPWGCVLLSPELVYVLGGKNYHETIYLTAPILSGALFHFFSFTFINIEKFFKSTKTIMIASVTAMIINIFLNYICIKIFGYQAAAYTTALCYLIIMLLHAFMVKYITGSYIIPLGDTLIICFASIAINLATMIVLETSLIIRIFIGIIVCFLVFFISIKIIGYSLLDIRLFIKYKIINKDR